MGYISLFVSLQVPVALGDSLWVLICLVPVQEIRQDKHSS